MAANTFNADDSLVKKYGIKENHEEVTALLFVEGSEDYVTMDEDDTLVGLNLLFERSWSGFRSTRALSPIPITRWW